MEVIDNQGDVYKELNGKDGGRPIPSKMGSRSSNLTQVLHGRGELCELCGIY